MKKQLFIAIMLITSSVYATHYRAQNQIQLDFDLNMAAFKGLVNEAQSAIEQGANVNNMSQWDITPLIISISAANPELVKILIRYGADISKPDINGKTPIKHVQERIETAQEGLKTAEEQHLGKETISEFKTLIENLYAIGHLVSPAAPAPEAPAAPRPEQAAAASSSSSSASAESTAPAKD